MVTRCYGRVILTFVPDDPPAVVRHSRAPDVVFVTVRGHSVTGVFTDVLQLCDVYRTALPFSINTPRAITIANVVVAGDDD